MVRRCEEGRAYTADEAQSRELRYTLDTVCVVIADAADLRGGPSDVEHWRHALHSARYQKFERGGMGKIRGKCGKGEP